MQIRSTELLAKMATHEGSYFSEPLVAPYSDHQNTSPVRVVFPDSHVPELPDDTILSDFKAQSLVYEDTSPDDSHRIYRLTADGLERGKQATSDI